MNTRLCQSVLCLLILLAAAPAAHALRCGTRLVGNGDYDIQVRDRCGEPYWIEDHYQYVVAGSGSPVEIVQQVVYTAWFYNFGSNRLLVRLLFRDGRLVHEETLTRGVDEIGDSCGETKMTTGISSGELVAYCGLPLSRNAQPILQTWPAGPGVYRQVENYREDWIYDLGGNFLRVLHLLNGRVDSVELIPR